MNIKIEKSNDDLFTLEIQSGHFTGTLTSVPKVSIESLVNELNNMLNAPKKTKTIWNPRAGRHEIVEE